jgi:predicted phage terminase large subunit-like protein
VADKANGPAVIQELQHDVDGLIEVTPEGGKIARAHAVSPVIESGNVYLPHPAVAPCCSSGRPRPHNLCGRQNALVPSAI